MNRKIVCYITDDNYLSYTVVSIVSLLRHNDNILVCVFNTGLTVQNLELLRSSVSHFVGELLLFDVSSCVLSLSKKYKGYGLYKGLASFLPYVKLYIADYLRGNSSRVLYINGSADSGVVSTNWFERMEILLASLVFGDSAGTNDIPQGVEMEGVDSSAVQSALTDFTYNQEFTGAINALDDTRQSFIGVLNGLHTSIKSVSLPASISIGLGGLDGEDTHDFNDMMHGHFQVSFNTGVADRFTIAVRAVTTISWVLLFFLALWKSGFYLIRKLVYFYRLVTRLLVSVFTR